MLRASVGTDYTPSQADQSVWYGLSCSPGALLVHRTPQQLDWPFHSMLFCTKGNKNTKALHLGIIHETPIPPSLLAVIAVSVRPAAIAVVGVAGRGEVHLRQEKTSVS